MKPTSILENDTLFIMKRKKSSNIEQINKWEEKRYISITYI